MSILAAHLIGLSSFLVGLAVGAYAGVKGAIWIVIERAQERGVSRGDILAFCELIRHHND